MKISVDMNVCQNYGQCVFAAPEVFDLDDAGGLVYQPTVGDTARGEVEAAAMACPVQAITIEG
ncbi:MULTISPECIES: ferredoxin [Prauserella salsuginis group]|uniref:Ferredoxin n=1 Tax=Prauserella salsuginis TaxID=387889 RepID=A0ABW6G4S0_9PSEU|nr:MULTISPECIES: ferredoxin [Prauserella salsuginis group]MCR3718758.1 Ferredoxin [Prauserella flava]MCR3733328.1 Ferredoxin [Prauserella salsuginis]